MGAKYAPMLYDAIPRYPKPPQVKTILERVYAFPKGVGNNEVIGSSTIAFNQSLPLIRHVLKINLSGFTTPECSS
ncbi:hypothetical protein [Alkalimarinus coralli]|uniref:hypothetical protein n=1 Tax=Alkalimarinus coralli TaxID=2935863 RepID=UPI00202B0608|nr:hypothetical protein [Alkalimarinus coralli]